MDDKKLDHLIKTSLTEGTQASTDLKARVWREIEQNIKAKAKGADTMTATKKRKPYLPYAAAAAVLVLTFAAFTPPGQAAVKRIKDVLLPEKQIVEELEGQKEKTKVSLQESEVGYTIYFDQERFHMEKAGGKDKIVPNVQPADEKVPEVFMEISQNPDKSPEILAQEIEAELKAKLPKVYNEGSVQEPVQGLLIRARSGQNWNDTVENYYLVSNGQKGSFIIRQHYFVEASEGYGARFYYMLKEFKLVEP